MKYAYPLGCAMLALLAQAAWAQNAAPAPASQPVNVLGCPKPGVEAGCIVLTDKGVTYNITAAKPKPDFGKLGIQLKGMTDPGRVSICMQGTPVKDITWSYTRQDCSH
jgi:hypothetical protein